MPNSQNEYQIRPIQPEDAEAIHALLTASATHYGTETPPLAMIEQMLGMFLPQLPQGSPLALTSDDKAAAFLLFMPQFGEGTMHAQAEVGIHPAHQAKDMLAKMADWASAHLQTFAKNEDIQNIQLRASFDDTRQDLIEFFSNWGFESFITQVRMQRDLAAPIPPPTFPEGVALRPYQPENSEAMRAVFNSAFANHWIGELTAEAWQSRFIANEKFRGDLTTLAWQDDEVVGFYLSEDMSEDDTQGWLEVMAVSPDHQRRGLGSSLLQHALHAYKGADYTSAGLDVDREGASNALALYEKQGFEKVKGTCYYRKMV